MAQAPDSGDGTQTPRLTAKHAPALEQHGKRRALARAAADERRGQGARGGAQAGGAARRGGGTWGSMSRPACFGRPV